MDTKYSTISISIHVYLNFEPYRNLMQLLIQDKRKNWYRIKKNQHISLIITLLNIAKLVTSSKILFLHKGDTWKYFVSITQHPGN
jgi:hypothetical protein